MAWLCAVLVATMTLAVPSTEEFDRGKTAFGRAEYARAIAILRPLLYPEVRLDSEADVVQAHRLLGVAHLFENQPDNAKQEFRKLLELRSDYRFDPLLDPPRVVEFFNRVLKEEEDEIAVLDSKRKQRDAELAARRQREADELCAAQAVTYSRHSYAINFIPFGAGQFQNGQRGKGWGFLGAEVALGAVSLGALTTNLALFGLSTHRRCLDAPTQIMPGTVQVCQKIDHSQEDLSRNLVRLQVVSGGLFLAAGLWGIIDAVRNFHPLGPAGSEPKRPGAGTSSGGATSPAVLPALLPALLRPTPIPVAGGSGLGLEWSY
jgi:hypothetical protein